jgi:sialate O-acetylesterase
MIQAAKYIILTCLTLAFSVCAVTCSAQSTFKLAAILQDNMVLQQGKPLRVWGTAKPGDVIKINADWTDRVSTAHADEQGNWIGQINVPKITAGNFTPHVMVIIDGNDNIKLSNLLIGDLWLCAGQSNMDMPVERMDMCFGCG